MNIRTFTLFILLLLPTVFSFVGINFQRAYYANDPDYIYLMNALCINRGKDVGHIDNPGTPVMELAALVIYVHHSFDPEEQEPLAISVIRNPEKYVEIVRQFFIFLISLIMTLVGWKIFFYFKSIWPAMVFQITPFLSVNVLEHAWTKVSPEPILLLISFIFTLIIFIFYFDERKDRYRYVLIFTLLSGFGLATKATFLPLIIVPFFLLKGWKKNLVYVIGFIATFFIFTSPAHNEYPRMFRWFRGLIAHKGIYGKGEKGLIDVESYFSSLGQIISNNLPFVIGLLILLVLTIRFSIRKNKRKNETTNWSQRVSWALIFSGVSGILLVAKHYHANHYLMPLLGITGLIYIFVFVRIKELFPNRKILPILSITFIVMFSFVFLSFQVPVLQNKYDGYVKTNREYEEVEKIIHCNYPDYSQLIYYPDALNVGSALKFGNGYSKLNNQSILEKVYPDFYFLNVFDRRLEGWSEPVVTEKVVQTFGYKILLKGRPLIHEDYLLVNSLGLPFKPVFEGRFQSIYLLDTTEMMGSLKDEAVRYKEIITCGAETVSFDKQYFQNGSRHFSSPETQTTDIVHTGVYAVKLDNLNKYALHYNLENCKPGQTIELSVWRNPADRNGFLVAALEDDSAFYMSSNNAVLTDRNGWQKLTLDFVIPDVCANQTLSFYLWNRAEDIIYFDDFAIKIK